MSIEYGEYQVPKAPEGRYVYSVKRDRNTAKAEKGEGILPFAPGERNVYN